MAGLRGLFLKDGEGEGDTSQTPTPSVAQTPRAPAPAPIIVTDLLSTPLAPRRTSSTPTASAQANSLSPQVQALVQQALSAIPASNAVVQLTAMMKNMESVIADPAIRKQAALAALAGQGVTQDTVNAGADEARRAVDKAFDDALLQMDRLREGDLAATRNEANSFRSQASAVDLQIKDLERQKADLESQAQATDERAAQIETQLNDLKSNIEVARTIATASFSS